MKAGDLIFVRGKGPVSSVIRWFDGGREFTHVAMAVSSNFIIESQYLVNTRIVPLKATYDDYEIVPLHLSPKQRQDVIGEAHTLIGSHYDYSLIFWLAIKRLFNLKKGSPWNNAKRLICSELISRVLYNVGYIDDFELLHELTPNQLYDMIQYLEKNRDNPKTS